MPHYAMDLTGKKFGYLTVIKRSGSNTKGEATWLCKCDCGNNKIVSGYKLRIGRVKSCGCFSMAKYSLIGQRFGRLQVLEPAEKSGKNNLYKCLCDCGKEKVIRASDLRSGKTVSCGCYGLK